MTLIKIAILAIVQGFAELLPVSSSAHVIVMQKLLGIDPTTPEMVFLLVMLHTGTMLAVILYFWSSWKRLIWQDAAGRLRLAKMLIIATAATGILGFGLMKVVEHLVFGGGEHGSVENLFGNLKLISAALASAGLLILFSARYSQKNPPNPKVAHEKAALWVGLVQGLCLPFRGFSRSGATISAGLIVGLERRFAEEFSFALAVILTPPVILRSFLRLLKSQRKLVEEGGIAVDMMSLVTPGLFGLLFSFLAGCLAIRWLSAWLERGKWSYFGYYCLVFAAFVYGLSLMNI